MTEDGIHLVVDNTATLPEKSEASAGLDLAEFFKDIIDRLGGVE